MNDSPEITVTLINRLKNEFDVDKLLISDVHSLLDKVIEYTTFWKTPPTKQEDLICKNEAEYNVLKSFRNLKKTNDDFFTKNICDKFVVLENRFFEQRNTNKIPNEPVIAVPEKKKKKGLFK